MSVRTLQNLLLALIIGVNLYVILLPVIPSLLFISPATSQQKKVLQAQIHSQIVPSNSDSLLPNNLTIPSMALDQKIYEGRDTYAVLNKGVMHLGSSSTPDKGGNTVLLGHRFTYSQPQGVFYHLDTLAVGDEIGVVWNQRRYIYRVSEIKVVKPTETSIEDQTPDSRLTLYTCTPLIWPKDRLVVTAKMVQP